jgi:hypothetical protein
LILVAVGVVALAIGIPVALGSVAFGDAMTSKAKSAGPSSVSEVTDLITGTANVLGPNVVQFDLKNISDAPLLYWRVFTQDQQGVAGVSQEGITCRFANAIAGCGPMTWPPGQNITAILSTTVRIDELSSNPWPFFATHNGTDDLGPALIYTHSLTNEQLTGQAKAASDSVGRRFKSRRVRGQIHANVHSEGRGSLHTEIAGNTGAGGVLRARIARIVLATGTVSFPRAGDATLTIRPTAAGRKALLKFEARAKLVKKQSKRTIVAHVTITSTFTTPTGRTGTARLAATMTP